MSSIVKSIKMFCKILSRENGAKPFNNYDSELISISEVLNYKSTQNNKKETIENKIKVLSDSTISYIKELSCLIKVI